VKAIREQRIYPTCRIRYQIVGQQYRHMILQTFRTTLPNVYRHLQRRECFADYLLQTGIFNNADLDRQHHQLYDRILNHYLERYQHREMFGRNGEPDRRTDNSVEQSIGGEGLENLSLLPHKDGRPYQSVKSDIFSLGSIHEGNGANGQDQLITVADAPKRRPVAGYDIGKAHQTFHYKGEDDESDGGYDSEPTPELKQLDIKNQKLFKPERKLIKKKSRRVPKLLAE